MRFLLVIYLFLLVGFSNGQESFDRELPSDFVWNTAVYYGFILPHYPNLSVLRKKHAYAIRIGKDFPKFSKTSWSQKYHHPKIGINALYLNAGNTSEIGHIFGVYPSISFPLFSIAKVKSRFRLGTGLGLVTQPFDRLDNTKNLAVGSFLNALFVLENNYSINVKNDISIHGGVSLMHLSNGSIKMPNLGLNIAMAQLGLSKTLGGPEEQRQIVSDLDRMKKWKYSVGLYGAKKEISPISYTNYFVQTIQIKTSYKLNEFHRIGLGVDGFRNPSNVDQLKEKNIFIEKDVSFRSGVLTFYEMYFGKLRASLEAGYYVFDRFQLQGNVYTRIGWKYQLFKHVNVSTHLKFHRFAADYIEWGAAYEW